jgi:hypothetical protein
MKKKHPNFRLCMRAPKGTPTGNVISGQDTRKKGGKFQIPRESPKVTSDSQKNAGKIRACARDHFRDFRSGPLQVMSIPVVNAHAITSGCACTRDHIGSTTTSHHLRKYDFVRAHILLTNDILNPSTYLFNYLFIVNICKSLIFPGIRGKLLTCVI